MENLEFSSGDVLQYLHALKTLMVVTNLEYVLQDDINTLLFVIRTVLSLSVALQYIPSVVLSVVLQ